MTNSKTSSLTAYDVVLDIVRAQPGIDSVCSVVYVESENWLDEVNGTGLTPLALKRALRQDAGPRIFAEIPRGAVLQGALLTRQAQLASNELLGITSRISTQQKGEMHIPMMDFHCAISSKNLGILSELLSETGQEHGFILESGRSYHYYGKEVLTRDQWIGFLGKCLLMKNFVDERYVGHQLVDRHCVLRLSTSPRKPVIPSVVYAF